MFQLFNIDLGFHEFDVKPRKLKNSLGHQGQQRAKDLGRRSKQFHRMAELVT